MGQQKMEWKHKDKEAEEIPEKAKKDANMPCTSIGVQVVYGLHTVDSRKLLWGKLKQIESSQQGPWLAMGDYNAIHKVEHRLIGSNVQEAEIKDFKSFLIENNMSVLRTMGREFCWTNGHTYTIIDWALENVSWMLDMPTSEVILLDPGYSDHCPLSLNFAKEDTSKAKPFKFMNHLAQHENFQEIVMRAWNQRHRAGKIYDV
ncbi:hypothetical protein CQW23_04366 [Capsicum baccatum]|uniref:Endonuclease/exonuclease/phosphatase domain-containing protein n=1 Tax=Capsicum baccatum TaxID=33114 RepID=A0A2G2XEI2_CAPBA|nr:hypothetical protein CQW23_04366 [Capsicum baccatum]